VNEWNYTSIFPYVSMKRCLNNQSENITLTLYQTVGYLHTDYSCTVHMTVSTASSAGRHDPMRNSAYSLISNAQRYYLVWVLKVPMNTSELSGVLKLV